MKPIETKVRWTKETRLSAVEEQVISLHTQCADSLIRLRSYVIRQKKRVKLDGFEKIFFPFEEQFVFLDNHMQTILLVGPLLPTEYYQLFELLRQVYDALCELHPLFGDKPARARTWQSFRVEEYCQLAEEKVMAYLELWKNTVH